MLKSLEQYYKEIYYETNGLIELPDDKFISNMFSFRDKDNKYQVVVDMLYQGKKYAFRVYNFWDKNTMYCEINGEKREMTDYAKLAISTIFLQYLKEVNFVENIINNESINIL